PPPNAWADSAAHPIVLDLLTSAPAPVEVTISARRGGQRLLGSITQAFPANVPVPTTAVVVPASPSIGDADCVAPPIITNEQFTPRGCSDATVCIAQQATPPATRIFNRILSTPAMDCSCSGICADNQTGRTPICPGALPTETPVVWRYYPPANLVGNCR